MMEKLYSKSTALVPNKGVEYENQQSVRHPCAKS